MVTGESLTYHKSQMKRLNAITAAVVASTSFASIYCANGKAQDFRHCSWNGKPVACRVTPFENGVDIYWSSGGEQRIVYAEGNKVWLINDGVREPGIIEGRTVTRLTDNVQFSF